MSPFRLPHRRNGASAALQPSGCAQVYTLNAPDDAGGHTQNRRMSSAASTTPATRMIRQSRIVRPLSSIAYLITSHLFVGGSGSCFLVSALAGDGFAGLRAVIVPSWCMLRKAPRCPAGEDACPRGVPIPRDGVNRAVASLSQTGARRASTTKALTACAALDQDSLSVVVQGSRRPPRTSRTPDFGAQVRFRWTCVLREEW